MKKLLVFAFALFGMTSMHAQDQKLFNRLAVGVGVGTTGITVDASTCITPYVGVRAGVNFFPTIKVNTDLDIEVDGQTSQYYNQLGALNGFDSTLPEDLSIKVQGKPSMTTGHVLFDLYPSKKSIFHLTVGAYFGGSEIIEVYNKEDGVLADVAKYNKLLKDGNLVTPTLPNGSQVPLSNFSPIGVALGDYFLSPKDDGSVNATLEVASFRPYVGFGLGRAVPKGRLGFQFDAGVQFWGTPKVYIDGANGKEQLTEEDTNGDDGGAIKTLSKITVYPCISFRLVGRIL